MDALPQIQTTKVKSSKSKPFTEESFDLMIERLKSNAAMKAFRMKYTVDDNQETTN